MIRKRVESAERGQALVVVAIAMVTIVASVGLVIDGGFAWGNQRQTQNAVDAASEAGAVVLAQRMMNISPTRTDADVAVAVDAAAAANGVTDVTSYYTDVYGNLLTSAGAFATSTADAAVVGAGVIPDDAQGVEAHGARTITTFLAQVIGVTQMQIGAMATSVAGYLEGTCPAASGCDILPVTVPVTVLGCDEQNDPAPVAPVEYWEPTSDPVSIPLCRNGPGNVGWMDWTPTEGGVSELEDSILSPDNPAVTVPGWYFMTATGNVNSLMIEEGINARAGSIVTFPQFDSTCDEQPTGPGVNDCPTGHVGGEGSNQWYHLPQFAAFQLCSSTIPECAAAGFNQAAYINGYNAVCDTGNGATSCIAGRFVSFIQRGTVGPGSGTLTLTNVVGVQLIR